MKQAPNPICLCGHAKSEHDDGRDRCNHVDEDLLDDEDEIECDCARFHVRPIKKSLPVKIAPKKTLPAVKAAMDAVKDKKKQGKKPKSQVMVYLVEIRIDMEEFVNIKEDLETTWEDLRGYGAVNIIDSGIVEGST